MGPALIAPPNALDTPQLPWACQQLLLLFAQGEQLNLRHDSGFSLPLPTLTEVILLCLIIEFPEDPSFCFQDVLNISDIISDLAASAIFFFSSLYGAGPFTFPRPDRLSRTSVLKHMSY